MSKIFKTLSVAALMLSSFGATTAAHAGGLFGDGGLIGGDVGNWLDENFENPITTPIAQGAAVVGGAAVGTYYGGAAGGTVGACAGQMVNSIFAGQGAGGCMGQAAQQAAQQYAQQQVQQYVPMGNVCYTPMGAAMYQVQPLGSGCMVPTPYGPVAGRIGQ